MDLIKLDSLGLMDIAADVAMLVSNDDDIDNISYDAVLDGDQVIVTVTADDSGQSRKFALDVRELP